MNHAILWNVLSCFWCPWKSIIALSCEWSLCTFHRWIVRLCCIWSVFTGVWNLGERNRWKWFRGGLIWCRSEVFVRWHCSETRWSLEPSAPESHLEVLLFIHSFMWSLIHFSNRSNHLRLSPLWFFLSQSIQWQLACGSRWLKSYSF